MSRRIPLITLILVTLTVLIYPLVTQETCECFGLDAGTSAWTLVSSLFLHDPRTLEHLATNMVALAVAGTLVETRLGHWRFLALYLGAGILGGLLHLWLGDGSTLIGASGAIFGVMAVLGVLRPYLLASVLVLAGINIWMAFYGGNGVSFCAHLGGSAAGSVFAFVLRASGDEAVVVA